MVAIPLLKLKRVELQGFKSFCDRTELKFQGSGIAAVVGPNGCGKSNLSDAITWVLGEQSARSLRGARMEDVIFAGTRNRKPVGMASVTMVLVDPVAERPAAEPASVPEGAEVEASVPTNVTVLPAKPSEVTITRRLFRSGESEYLIDGRQARLRDIQDIFMGSGLGPESYAIIEQGRIGQILSSKPSDRRGVIEEAAGITRYKSRKRLAEAKLEGAKQNLARVFDILEEVTRQVNSLKRQAAKAKRYTELKTDLDSRLRTLLSARFQVLDAEAKDAALSLEEASAQLKQLSEQTASGDHDRGKLQEVCYQLERDLTAQRKQLAEINVESERTRGKLEAQVRESGAIEQRMTRGEEEGKDLENRLMTAQAERDTLAVNVKSLETGIAESRALLIEKNQVRDRLQNQLRDHEKAIESNRVTVLRLLGEAATMKNQLAQVDEFLAGIDRETTRVRTEEKNAQAEVERLITARRELSEAIAQRQMELESVTGEKNQTGEALAAKRALSVQTRQQLDQLRGECSRFRAKKESLENVISHHTYTTDSVKRLFNAAERAKGFEPLGVLADFVEVDATYERAAEEFLRDELEYVVVRNWEQAERGMSIFHPATGDAMEGRATFLIEEGSAPAPTPESTRPELARLVDHLRLTNGLSHQAEQLLPRLSNCYIATDSEAARDLAAQHPALYFLLPTGQCYHGRTLAGGHKKASGPLALKRELREVSKALNEQERTLAERTKAFESLGQEIAALEQNLERLRSLQQTREKDALALGHEMRKLSDENNRANSRISVARLDLERLTRERDRSLETRDRNRTAVAQKDEERTAREQALEAARHELETAAAEAGRIREEHSTLRAELAALEERHRAGSAALARLEQQIREVTHRRTHLSADIERMGEHRARLLAENIELDARASTLAQQVEEADAAVLVLAEQEGQRRRELQAVDESLKELRTQTEAGHKRRGEIEVELVRRQSELKFLDETSRKELNLGLGEITGESDPSTELDLNEIERGYKEIKGKIESLGPINSQALEEFEEAQVRQDFLTAQRQDLLDSIRDTEKAIHEIDAISRTRFQEAFDAINQNFKQSFETLFGGGSGEMRLTDESNAAESGIDIIASPPGKKLQNVLLLSGGEKSMAAMALLMAIFKFQPSPFCVLDEVDAPLDEANIGRLTRLLKEMAVDTQFIIITHSKKTMESAQSMYGVTMQEAGISKLVSVRLNAVTAEAAVA